MAKVMYKVLLDAPLEAVWAFFEDVEHGLTALSPPEADVRITRADQPAMGAEVVMRVKTPLVVGGRKRWHAKYVEYQPPTGDRPYRRAWFVDEQIEGPFKRWKHTHRFEETVDEGRTKVWAHDQVDYTVGYGPLGPIANRLIVRRKIDAMFAHRQKVLRERLSRRSSHR